MAANGKIWTQNAKKSVQIQGNLKDISTPATGEGLITLSPKASQATYGEGAVGCPCLPRTQGMPFESIGGHPQGHLWMYSINQVYYICFKLQYKQNTVFLT